MTPPSGQLSLPARGLLVLWLGLLMLTVLAWGLLLPTLGMPGTRAGAGLMGGVAALVVCGGGLLAIAPWRVRPGSDLPTLWLLVTVVRLLGTPMLAVLLYFAAHPPVDVFVIGLAISFLSVLVLETPLIALDIRRQLAEGGQ